MLDLKKFRKDLEDFNREIGLEYYEHGAGLKDEFEISKIYNKYNHLFSRETLSQVKMAFNNSDEGLKRSLRYILEFVVDGYMENQVKNLVEEYYTLEATLQVEIDGEKLPYRYAAVKIANEDNREKRKTLFQERLNVEKTKLTPLLEKIWERQHEIARDLGYHNYMDLYRNLTGIDYEKLLNILVKLADKVKPLYKEEMSAYIEEQVGVSLKEAEKHDISYVFRAKDFDKYFPKENLVPLLKKYYKGLGIDMDSQKNITLDLEERPKKSPRAFMVPIIVPDDVRLVVLPKGGVDDYSSLFHEAGHLEHFANTDPNLEPEFKYLGDNSVTETYAFLSEYMLNDVHWLEENIKMDKLGEYLRFQYLNKAYFILRYTAKLEYEIKLHTQGIKGMGKVYKETLEKYLYFKHPEEHYLIDVDPGFYSAQYLRAWLLEAMLREKLREKFGVKWFKDKQAGNYLRNLWSLGQKYNADEIATRIGFSEITWEPFYNEIEEVLKQ